MVFRHKRWKQYAEQVDEAMYDRYGYSVCEKQVVEIQSVPEDLEPVNARELLSAILEDMVRNVDVGFRGFGENRRLVRCRREAEHLKCHCYSPLIKHTYIFDRVKVTPCFATRWNPCYLSEPL